MARREGEGARRGRRGRRPVRRRRARRADGVPARAVPGRWRPRLRPTFSRRAGPRPHRRLRPPRHPGRLPRDRRRRRSPTVLEGFSGAAKVLGLDVVRRPAGTGSSTRETGRQGDDRGVGRVGRSRRACSRRSTGCGADRSGCTRSGWAWPRSMDVQPDGRPARVRGGRWRSVRLAGATAGPVGGSVRAAVSHFNPAHRMAARAAFAAHTKGAWRGSIHRTARACWPRTRRPRSPVWQTPAGHAGGLPHLVSIGAPSERGPDDPTPLPRCLRTVVRGVTIFEE